MKVRIDHLDANPFRHIDRYPIREDKIAALRESITTTGFWDNLVGRQVGDRVQIAYGHHRREALLREHSPDHLIDIVVREFNDEQMLQIMARENMEEWGTSAMVEIETVSAVVQAYGDGRIQLGKSSGRHDQLRYAPSFALGDLTRARDASRPYTAKTVADFLGWVEPSGLPQDKVSNALKALAFIEQGHLTEEDFAGLGTHQARGLVEETGRTLRDQQRAVEEAQRATALVEQRRKEAAERAIQAEAARAAALERAKAAKEQVEQERAEREWKQRQRAVEEAEAKRVQAERAAREVRKQNEQLAAVQAAETKKITQAVRQDLRSGGGYKNARQVADKIRRETRDDAPRDLDREVRSVASAFENLLTESTMARRLNMVLGYRKHMTGESRDQLVAGLTALREDIDKVLKKLGAVGVVSPEQDFVVVDGDFIDAEVV